MPDPTPEATFLAQLPWIEKAAAIVCRRHGVWDAEAEDFAAWVKMKLMEDDYAVFQKFRGESDIRTFIATVVARHFNGYSRERRGRWRLSAAAERMGPPASDLEILVYRDGYTLEQAGEKLRTAGRTTLSDAQLARLFKDLPERAPLRPVEVAAEPVLGAAEGTFRADARVAAAEAEAERSDLVKRLAQALDELSPEERMIVRLHFGDGLTLAQVARTLRVDQKPLYRLVPRLRERLREALERAGVSAREVRGLLHREEP